MPSYDQIEPDPQLIPEREEWLVECPTCGGLAFGASPEDAIEDWREHSIRLHHPTKPEVRKSTSWTIAELREEFLRFEADAHQVGIAENSFHTYVDWSARFVRWLAGEFEFQGGR